MQAVGAPDGGVVAPRLEEGQRVRIDGLASRVRRAFAYLLRPLCLFSLSRAHFR